MKDYLESVDAKIVIPEAMKKVAEREQLFRDTVIKELRELKFRQYLHIGIIVVLFLLLLFKSKIW